jgi:hypothetical protein
MSESKKRSITYGDGEEVHSGFDGYSVDVGVGGGIESKWDIVVVKRSK